MQTAHQARGGRSHHASQKSESGDMAGLRQEVQELRTENIAMRKEIDELRQMILKVCWLFSLSHISF